MDKENILELLADLKESEVKHYFWKEGDLFWKLDSLQNKIKRTIKGKVADKICILSSRQIGKSFLSVVLALEYCIERPGSIVRILAPTLKQVQDIVQDNLAPICLDAPSGLITRSKSDYRYLIGESSLRLGAIERAHVDNNRGGNADLVIFEEGGFVSSDDYKYAVESVIGPQLLRSGGQEIHISSPSEDPEHHLHNEIKPHCEASGMFFCYTVYDSPSITPKQIDKAIERCGGVETEAFQREYMAKIIRSKSLMIVPEFDEARHVKEITLPSHYNGVQAIDLGGSRDKTAGYNCIWDFSRAKLLIKHELFHNENTPSSEVISSARDLLSKVTFKHVFVDIPGETQIDWAALFGFPVATPLKHDRDSAINGFRLLFQKDQIEIDPSCEYLIGCLKSGRYNSKRTDFLRTERYGHADPIMAAVYGARMVDRITNPYPPESYNKETQLRLDYKNKTDDNLREFAESLIPWNPARKIAR